MEFWDYFSVVVTTLGAAVSMIQAINAKKSAKIAKSYRDEIALDRSKMTLLQLLPDAKRAREECRKIIKPVSDKANRGVDPQKVIN